FPCPGRAVLGKVCLGAGIACVLVFALLNITMLGSADFMAYQMHHVKIAAIYNRLFPYYLVPSGLPVFWGLQHLVAGPKTVWVQNALILVAAALFLLTFLLACRFAWRRNPVGLMVLIMLAFGAQYFLNKGGFTLFKLAMFAQPFVLGMLVVARQRSGWRP